MRKQPKWHLIYYALAAFDLLAVASSLFLSHQVMGIYRGSVENNQVWASYVGALTELNGLAQKTNAPGNDVFDTKLVDKERASRNKALAKFKVLRQKIQRDLEATPIADNKLPVQKAMRGISAHMDDMVKEADQIFQYFENGEGALAGTRMATMDRKYAILTNDIADASRAVQAIQARNFKLQLAKAAELRMFEYGIGLLILFMVVGVTIYGHKIAQAMRAHEESLKDAKQEAEEANRSKSEFLASMSHEIRTPMNGVLGMVNNLLGGKLTSDQREQVQIIKDLGETLLDLLNDILDLSKVEAGRLELENIDFKISGLLASTIALWESRAQNKGLQFNIHNELGDLDIIRADGGRLRQVLYNLISNALKFSESGSIDVFVRQQPRDDNKLGIRFEVRDTGIGLDEHGVAKLFQPFSQADKSTTRKFGGTGLGLAICKKIVELQGGEIGVESRPGEGSCFWFNIVVDEGDANNLIEETDTNDEVADELATIGKTLRILAAEDNHVNQKVLEVLLAPLNCRTDFVGNGLEALQQIQKQSYDIVLMDVQMPEMDGPTATQKIRAFADPAIANIPIIALTANAMKGDREQYLAVGMNDYVSKPIDQVALFGAILRCTDNPELDAQSLQSMAFQNNQSEAKPLSEDAAAELDDFMSELDDLIDPDIPKSA